MVMMGKEGVQQRLGVHRKVHGAGSLPGGQKGSDLGRERRGGVVLQLYCLFPSSGDNPQLLSASHGPIGAPWGGPDCSICAGSP